MFYTKKGDGGTTNTFSCDQRISKSSIISEALGSLDEVNSFLGLCKIKSKKSGFKVSEIPFEKIIDDIQQSLFVVQAEFAGAEKKIEEKKIIELEKIIDEIEKELPPIKSFFVSGGTEIASLFDFARTIARRAERRAVAVNEEGKIKITDNTLAYLNRLSSALYALARLSNYKSGITEETPSYE